MEKTPLSSLRQLQKIICFWKGMLSWVSLLKYIHTQLFKHNRIRVLLRAGQSFSSKLIEAARHTFPEQSRTAAVPYEAENVAATADAVHGSQLAWPGKE